MLGWIRKAMRKETAEVIPSLRLSKVRSYDDYKKHLERFQSNDLVTMSFERRLLPEKKEDFFIDGYCYVCKEFVSFQVGFGRCREVDSVLMPNWREGLVCPGCHLNNRMRATVHIFKQECQPNTDSQIYITEQTTPLFRWFNEYFAHVCGSEMLGDSIAYGSRNDKGIRNENSTKLSFSDKKFDFILCFDVLEHIPCYTKALKECFRCLKSNATLYFSVPFIKTAEKNVVRARVSENEEVIHLLPPEYHGDPLSSDGCLCFYHFGWEILNDLSAVGFEDPNDLLYWSQDFGYLGGEQIIFTATKP